MANHRYENPVYYTDINMAHGLGGTNTVPYSMVPVASSHQYSSRQSAVAPGLSSAQYDSSINEPVAKKRRVDRGSSAAGGVLQKKWTLPDLQQWTDVQAAPTTKSVSILSNSVVVPGGTSTKPQQLPTPQTPRFPHRNTTRLNASGEERIVTSQQSDRDSTVPLTSVHQYSAPGKHQTLSDSAFNFSFDSQPQSLTSTARSPELAFHQGQKRLNYSGVHATQKVSADVLPGDKPQQAPDQPRVVSPRPDNKSKSGQTLSLEKDAHQIQALIAAKRLENENNSFLKRLQQKQVTYRNSKTQNATSTPTDSSGLSSPQMALQSNNVAELIPDHFSAESYFPPQLSNESSMKQGSRQISRPATPGQSATYTSQPLVQTVQSIKQDPNSTQLRSELMKASISMSSSNLSNSPSPHTNTKLSHTPEIERLKYNSNRRDPTAVVEQLQAAPITEIRAPRSAVRPQEQNPVRRSSVQHPVSAISTIMDSSTSALRRGVSSDSYKHTPTTDWEWPKSAASFTSHTAACTEPESKTIHNIDFDHFPSPVHGSAGINVSFQTAHHHNANEPRSFSEHSQIAHELPQTIMAPPLTSPLTNSPYPSMQQGLYYSTAAAQNNSIERPATGGLDTLIQTTLRLPTAATGHSQPQPQPQLQAQAQAQAQAHVLNSSIGMYTTGGGYNDYHANLRKHGVC